MSARTTQFDAETGRSLPRNATQPRSRSEGRHESSREGRGTHRSRSGANDVEPTEVSISHKKAHGKMSEKAQLLKISKARAHAASAVSGDSSPQSLEYVSASNHPSSRNTQDFSPKAPSNLYASMHMADSERTKFMDNIPGIPASEQLGPQRGDRAGLTAFPPSSVSKYGQNVAYPSSDLKSLPRDSNNTTDLVFHKSPANRHVKGLRVKGQAETEMQWNVTPENNYRLRDEQRNRSATNECHYSRTRGRRSKDGVNIVYNDVKFSGSNRQNVSRRSTSTSTSSYSEESPTDSQGSSTESESFSSSDSSHKRRRRIRRKPSNKSIGSSIYGEDNTSESENQSVSEFSASDNAHSYRKRRTQLTPEESTALASLVSFKEHRSNKLRSSSLTSVSSLEGVGISSDTASRNQSPLISPKGTCVSKVKKIQIRSFTSFADSQLNNKENLPQRRRSTEEREPSRIRGRAETAPQEIPKLPLARQGSESPSLSKSPFSLRSKAFARKTSKESLFSDSECNHTPDKGHESTMFDSAVGREQVTRCNSAPPVPVPDASGLLSSRSAFVPVKPNKRTNDHEPNPPIVSPVSFVADAVPDKGTSTTVNDLLRPVARLGMRPLSIVQETDEFADILQNDTYENENLENFPKKSHVNRSSLAKSSQECRSSPPCLDDNTSISTLRRLSYVKAQINSADLPVHSSDLMPDQSLDINSSSDFSPPFSTAFSEDLPSRKYTSEATNDTKRVLKEFDPLDCHEVLRTVASPVAEGDLISFDDENGEAREPVKKRTKRITRPKIPTILGGEATDKTINMKDLENFEAPRDLLEESDVSFTKGKLKI